MRSRSHARFTRQRVEIQSEPGVIVTPQSQSATANRDRDLITREELSQPSVSALSVLDAIRSLRPQYLSVRGTHTAQIKDAQGRNVVDEESGKVHASLDGTKIVSLD